MQNDGEEFTLNFPDIDIKESLDSPAPPTQDRALDGPAPAPAKHPTAAVTQAQPAALHAFDLPFPSLDAVQQGAPQSSPSAVAAPNPGTVAAAAQSPKQLELPPLSLAAMESTTSAQPFKQAQPLPALPSVKPAQPMQAQAVPKPMTFSIPAGTASTPLPLPTQALNVSRLSSSSMVGLAIGKPSPLAVVPREAGATTPAIAARSMVQPAADPPATPAASIPPPAPSPPDLPSPGVEYSQEQYLKFRETHQFANEAYLEKFMRYASNVLLFQIFIDPKLIDSQRGLKALASQTLLQRRA